MKRIIPFVMIILCASCFFAQVDETKNYVYKFDGSVEYGNIVEYERRFLQSPKIMIDNKKEISAYEVKFYKAETGFYGNVGGKGTSTFAQRERKGNVNLFKLVQINTSPGMYHGGYGGMGGMGMGGGYYTSGTTTRSIKYYYNKGFDDLKRATYKNLMVDLAGNNKSMIHLNYYKRARNIQIGCSVAAFGAMIAGTAITFASVSDGPFGGPSFTGMFVGIGAGIGFGIAGACFGMSKHKHLKGAIDAYNE